MAKPDGAPYAGLADAASHLRMFLNAHDTDGAVGAAEAVAAATNALLGPEALLKARVTELLIALLTQLVRKAHLDETTLAYVARL